jgi:hypothetical protein
MLIVEDNRYELHLFVNWSYAFSRELLEEFKDFGLYYWSLIAMVTFVNY